MVGSTASTTILATNPRCSAISSISDVSSTDLVNCLSNPSGPVRDNPCSWHEKNRAPGSRDSANVRNGTRAKTVLTHATGEVELQVHRHREGTFEPVIVRKRQRRLTEVDEIVLSLYARGLTTAHPTAERGKKRASRRATARRIRRAKDLRG